MKFVINKVNKNSSRIGHLLHQESETSFQTPLLIQCTKGGSVPHLSNEVFSYISDQTQILLLSLSTINYMAEALTVFKKGISAFVGYPNSPTILTIKDVCERTPSGYNDKDVVPLFTRRGKESVSAQQYMELMEEICPDLYIALYDSDTNEESSKKRVQKSVERTQKFFNYCYQKHKKSEILSKKSILAPIVGGYSKYARSLSIKNAKEKADIAGYVLDGFHNNGLSATKLNLDSLIDVAEHCIKELDLDKPKFMIGAYTPLAVVEMVNLGVDVFDTSYAYVATINFKALTFNFDLTKKEPSKPSLDLTDKELKEDFTPFLEGCKCTACQQHTRAYVHHLYNTRELLGPILLMIHNLHHYMEFFSSIRSAVASDSLQSLIILLRSQNSGKEVDYSIEELPKIPTKTDDKKVLFREMAVPSK